MRPLFYAGLIAIASGTVGSLFPLWRSRRSSPASIQRRVYWTGSLIGSALLFVAALPDWRSAVFVSLCAVFVVVVVAYRFTSHIKVGGRIYEYMRDPRKPDPPPALGRDGGE
jgi:MFS family permease